MQNAAREPRADVTQPPESYGEKMAKNNTSLKHNLLGGTRCVCVRLCGRVCRSGGEGKSLLSRACLPDVSSAALCRAHGLHWVRAALALPQSQSSLLKSLSNEVDANQI